MPAADSLRNDRIIQVIHAKTIRITVAGNSSAACENVTTHSLLQRCRVAGRGGENPIGVE